MVDEFDVLVGRALAGLPLRLTGEPRGLLKPPDAREAILSGDDEPAALLTAAESLLQQPDHSATRRADREQNGIVLTAAR
jgi:hypothetical protein